MINKFYFSSTKYNPKRKTNSKKTTITIQGVLCIFIGVFIGFSLATWLRTKLLNCSFTSGTCCLTGVYEHDYEYLKHLKLKNQFNTENALFKNIESTKNLVFIGVMTAQKYLDTRARAVYETWGQGIPGKMSFFSRAGSKSQYPIPLVSLPGVDDSYPPQKKSFMMLKYMHDNYIDKFEWFMRVDDDVYIKPEKLEPFLRSLNSSKPQFIGQAGLGNKDEFGLLSLDYDENFCMGGPGIVMSRETLKLVVPHISSCLKNLYSTHEDVEIGRCVKRFAGVSCTWSYEVSYNFTNLYLFYQIIISFILQMQHIFHHNSSGNEAFTRDLLSREVLRAISLHPVKQSQYQYRLHNFFNLRKIIDLRQKNMNLQREIRTIQKQLLLKYNNNNNKTLTAKYNDIERQLDNMPKDRFKQPPTFKIIKTPKKRQHRHDFTFFTRSLFSASYISPKRGAEGYWKNAINDAMRQIMEDINKNSIQRGRVIDFKDVLYGYMRHHPLIGIDYVIDALLVYRKYEGRKMTVPVRRHAYIRQTYTDMLFREDNNFDSIYLHRDTSSSRNSNNNENQDENLNSNEMSFDEQLTSLNQTFFLNNNLIQHLVNFILPSINKANNNDLLNRHKKQIKGLFNNDNAVDMKNPNDIGKKRDDDEFDDEDISNEHKIDYQIEKKINDKIIHFVMPLSGRLEIFKRFIKNFENVCLKKNENVKLAIVLFTETSSGNSDGSNNNENVINEVNKLVDNLKYKYLNEHLRVIPVKANFSRSVACEIGAALYSSKSLIFFVDVDILFSREFLLRVRMNTIESKQVYFPIVFSEYDPDPGLVNESNNSDNKNNNKPLMNHFEYNSETGYWRQFGFGIVAAYNSDLRRVGGFDTSIIGWGKEDVDLYEKFVKSNITVFRSVDPGLVHVFHKIKCDPNLPPEQSTMCLGSKSTSIASQRTLANIIYKRKLYEIEPTSSPNQTFIATNTQTTPKVQNKI